MDDRRILLRTEHLHKEYDGTTVLKDVSLSVKKGEVIVIIGPSGCGKSTFLRCLNGLEPIQGGQITLDMEDAMDMEAWTDAAAQLHEGQVKLNEELHKRYDDVLIMADPYDITDHFQDGYYVVPFGRFMDMQKESLRILQA